MAVPATPAPVTPPVPAAPVAVVDSQGNVSYARPEDLASLSGLGYSLATPEQEAVHQAAQGQAGIGGGLKAAAEAALSTATFGLSPWLETASGLRTPEDIKAGEIAHPGWSFLGSVGGAVAPLAGEEALASRGLTGLSRIAGGAPGLIADVGEGTTSLVRSAVQPGSRLGRIGADVLSRGAGSAIEGAAYGLGQSVSEDALDPDLTVESAFSRGVADSLLGAGLGAAVGTPLGLVSSVLKELPSGAKLADQLEAFEGERNLKIAGAIQSDLTRAEKALGGGPEARANLIRQANEARDVGILKTFNSPEGVYERATQFMQDVGQKMRDFITGVDSAAKNKAPLMGDASELIKNARNEIAGLEKNPFQQGAARQLSGYVDFLERAQTNDFNELRARLNNSGEGAYGSIPKALRDYEGKVTVQSLWELRQQVSEAIYGWAGNQDPNATAIKRALRSFRGLISDEMTAAIDRSGQNTAQWKGLNRGYQVAATMQDLAERGLNRSHGNNVLSLTETMAALAGASHGGPLGVLGAAGYIGARRHGSDVLAAAADMLAKRLRGKAEIPPVPPPAGGAERAAAVPPLSPAEAAAKGQPHDLMNPQGWAKWSAEADAAKRAQGLGRMAQARSGAMADAEAERAAGTAQMGQLASNALGQRGQDVEAFVRANPELGPQLVAKSVAMTGTPVDRVNALAALERIQRETLKEAQGAAGDVIAGRGRATTKAPPTDEILKTVERVNRLTNMPDQTAQLVQQISDETHEHAPTMTAKTGEVAGRVINYLQSQAPQASKPYPMGPEIKPDRSALIAFHEKVEAVKDPIGSLRRNPSKAVVEAVQAVYPVLLHNIRSAIIAGLADSGARAYTPQQRTAIANILGTDVDGSQSPRMVALSQQAYAAMNKPAPPHRASGRFPSSARAMTYAERLNPAGGSSLRNP